MRRLVAEKITPPDQGIAFDVLRVIGQLQPDAHVVREPWARDRYTEDREDHPADRSRRNQ